MAGYVYGEQPDDPAVIKLNTNESPFPPSPAVQRALEGFDARRLRRYPAARADALRGAFAAKLGLDAGQIVATNGGDEALRLALATFVGPGGVLGVAEPSYSLLPVLAAAAAARVAGVPLTEDWLPPADAAARLNAAGARLTCLVNPHAPSGRLLGADAIAALAAQLDGVLLVDEAYVDFVAPARAHDLTALVSDHRNLLLLRTLSKGYGLAGLRVGFLAGDEALIGPVLNKTRDSFNVDAIAQALAVAALGDDAYARDCWRRVRAERARLADRLRALGFEVVDSEANFLLARAPAGANARALQAALRERKILVRHFDAPRLVDKLRITVGASAQNDMLLGVLGEAAPGGAAHASGAVEFA